MHINCRFTPKSIVSDIIKSLDSVALWLNWQHCQWSGAINRDHWDVTTLVFFSWCDGSLPSSFVAIGKSLLLFLIWPRYYRVIFVVLWSVLVCCSVVVTVVDTVAIVTVANIIVNNGSHCCYCWSAHNMLLLPFLSLQSAVYVPNILCLFSWILVTYFYCSAFNKELLSF